MEKISVPDVVVEEKIDEIIELGIASVETKGIPFNTSEGEGHRPSGVLAD